MFFRRKKLLWVVLLGFLCLVGARISGAQSANTDAVKPYIASVEQAKEGMTLWQMVASGGFVMFVLALTSVFMIYMVAYNFMSLKEDLIVPKKFTDEFLAALEEGDPKKLAYLCETQPSTIAGIVKLGLEKRKKGIVFAREAIENSVRKELGKLWQNISYLADVANIAPLIGLLGTVLGMIQAFNVIAFQTAVVKPILLAGGVSKAMVTTAGGLIVAIPAFLFYSYFRGRVQTISNSVETFSGDVIKAMEMKSAASSVKAVQPINIKG